MNIGKGEGSIIELENIKYFAKVNINGKLEAKNYKKMINLYKVPILIRSTNTEAIYEYIKSLESNTLHEYLYFSKNVRTIYAEVFSQYEKNLELRLVSRESKMPNRKFFMDRIYILQDQINNGIFKKEYYINDKKSDVIIIIADAINIISVDKKIISFCTQGDPTDTNISLDGYFTDFECAGRNSILGEISIFFSSICTHGMYYYPKYNPHAYRIRPSILNDYQENAVHIDFMETNQEVHITYKHKIGYKNKHLSISYFEMFLKNLTKNEKKSIDKYLKYYLVARMLTPITLDMMEKNDQLRIISLIHIINEEINSLNDLVDFIKAC